MLALVGACAGPADAASPFSWSPPAVIDHQPPFGFTRDTEGASCPSVSLCVLVGDGIATSTNPTGGASDWSTFDPSPGDDLYAVSCPSTSLCVAVDRGHVVTSTNPA